MDDSDACESTLHARLSENLGKIITDQMETICFLDRFLKETGTDAQLMNLYETWKAGLCRFMEIRYKANRLQNEAAGEAYPLSPEYQKEK